MSLLTLERWLFPLLVEHEVTESTTVSGSEVTYYCAIYVVVGYSKDRVASAISDRDADEAKRKAFKEFGETIDRYLRVYDRLRMEGFRE